MKYSAADLCGALVLGFLGGMFLGDWLMEMISRVNF